MSLTSIYADPYTRMILGPSGMVELSRNLWARNCQTCGDRLGDQTPSLVVFDSPDFIEASLHHARCCPPQWTRLPRPYNSSSATDSVRIIGLPQEDGGIIPVLIINPNLERVKIACDDHRQWTVTTVTDWATYGLRAPGPDGYVSWPADGMDAWYVDGKLTVTNGETVWTLSITDSHPEITDAMTELGCISVAVSTALDPAALTDIAPFGRAIETRDAACGYIRFNTADPPPRRPTFDPRDESGIYRTHNDEFSELPFQYFHGPSYDPVTGSFDIGATLDGQACWKLNTPGGNIHNGLIVGPPGCGKTNVLRIVAVEAAASGLFVLMLADPQDSNRHATGLGRVLGEEYFSNELPGAAELLRTLNRIITYRQENGGFGTPTQETPGVLLLLEDAHTVFPDPELARLGERIVKAGPTVCVGLVVTAETIDLEAFSGNLSLLVHLSDTNGHYFSERALAQIQVYRSRVRD
jgi:hypothetical protein